MVDQLQETGLKVTGPVQLQLLGCVYYGDPFHSAKEWSYENEIGKLWNRFFAILGKYSTFFESLSSQPKVSYEVHLEPFDYDGEKNKDYYVFVGLSVQDFNEIPIEMFVKTLPTTKYLEFTTLAVDQDETANKVFSELIGEGKQYQQSFPFIVQRYTEEYKGLNNPKSRLDWLVPIQ